MKSGSAFLPRRCDQRSWLWIGLIGIASILLSRAFACATPFAALATLSAFTLRRRQSVALIVSVWFANQVIGFGWPHYPRTPSTFAWGMAIGVAALASLMAACEVARRTRMSLWISVPLALTGALTFLPTGLGAFAPPVLFRIVIINVTALGLLLSAHFMARTIAGQRAQAAP
jgi:hypothetical protein